MGIKLGQGQRRVANSMLPGGRPHSTLNFFQDPMFENNDVKAGVHNQSYVLIGFASLSVCGSSLASLTKLEGSLTDQ